MKIQTKAAVTMMFYILGDRVLAFKTAPPVCVKPVLASLLVI